MFSVFQCVFLKLKRGLFNRDKGAHLTKHFDCEFCRTAEELQIWKSLGGEVYVSCPLNWHSHPHSQSHSHNAPGRPAQDFKAPHTHGEGNEMKVHFPFRRRSCSPQRVLSFACVRGGTQRKLQLCCGISLMKIFEHMYYIKTECLWLFHLNISCGIA